MFKREKYLNLLIQKRNNHLVKVITGIRRCGKSYLLNQIFAPWLLTHGFDKDHIIRFSFDSEEDIIRLDSYLPEIPTVRKENGQGLINDRKFLAYVKDQIKDDRPYCFLLDEVQNLEEFVRVLNSLASHENFDVYVTGSNSHLLSSEVDTEFGGRASRIHLLPLTFAEYLEESPLAPGEALNEYLRYGGIPLVVLGQNDEEKEEEAISIYRETYLKDIKARHPRTDMRKLEDSLHVIASMISTPINPSKIENTFRSVYGVSLSDDTIDQYISWCEEAYLLSRASRYDVKGRHYIGSPYKIYFEDIGIRNAILNFRDVDQTDLIENVVYNELRYRGYQIDVGIVNIPAKEESGKRILKDTEVDFVAYKGPKKYYVQVAYRIDSEKKKNQEYESLWHIPDSFRKVIVVKEEGKPYFTEEGFLRISLLDFLRNENSLDL